MKRLLLIAAFFEGFLLLAVELVYVRLLHPVYGDSYYIWIAMLAVTMLGLLVLSGASGGAQQTPPSGAALLGVAGVSWILSLLGGLAAAVVYRRSVGSGRR